MICRNTKCWTQSLYHSSP